MATHKLGKLKFRIQDRGIEFRWGDGEIRRFGLGKKSDGAEYDDAYEQEGDGAEYESDYAEEPMDDARESAYSGRFSGDESEYDDYVDDAYADDQYADSEESDDGYADGDYADDGYADDGYADDGYSDDGRYADDEYAAGDYSDDDYARDDGYADDDGYAEDDGEYADEDGYYDENGEYVDDGEYAGEEEYPGDYPEGTLGNVLRYVDENDWVTYLLLFLLPPLGIYLLWRRNRFDQTLRYVLTAGSAVWFIVLVILLAMQLFGGHSDVQTGPNLPTLAPAQTTEAEATATPEPEISLSPSATVASDGTGAIDAAGTVAPSATPITGANAGTSSNLVWVSSSGLLYHKNNTCSLIGASETVSQVTLDNAKQRNKFECPECYGGEIYYATQNGSYYHKDPTCSGMNNAVVFPKDAADTYHKTACPVCVTGEKKSLDDGKTATGGVYINTSTKDQSGVKVWCTQGGQHYHTTANCSGMQKASQISLRDAILAGKTACSTCCAAAATQVYCRSDGTYYHANGTCSGMKNAKAVTLAEAMVLGKKRCPTCLPQTQSENGSNQTTGQYYVYATPTGKYYHTNRTCGGMKDAVQVTLSSMIEAGRPACPTCCSGAEMSVYVSKGGTYYHSYATCSGMTEAVEGTLARALALGYQKCPKCWGSKTTGSTTQDGQSTDNTTTSNTAYTATSDTIMVYARQDGSYYHTKSNCSGMKDASHISLRTAIEAGKKACPTCASAAEQLVYSTQNGKYYHKIADCSNMQNASRRTIADALMLGQTACRVCWNAETEDQQGDPLPNDNADVKFTVGTSGIKVYAAVDQKYFHLKSNCTSGLTQVALETALNYGKTACPTCAKVADQEVYATPNGKYYHVSQSCAGSGAVSGSLAKAVALGFKPCPYCVVSSSNGTNGNNGSAAEISQEIQQYGNGSGTYTAGKSGVKVYSKASDRYYHSSKSCAGSGAVHVTLETAMNYGKRACPECCSIAEKTVYAVRGSSTFHARKSHAGNNAVAGTLAQALAYGMKPCSTCFTPTNNAGTVTPGEDYSAAADSSVYVDLYSDDYYYHKDSKCSQTGMSGGTAVTLEFAKDLGYARCPYCNPPSSIQ